MWHSESLGLTLSVGGYLSDYLTYRPVSSGDIYLLIICWIHVKTFFNFRKNLKKLTIIWRPPCIDSEDPLLMIPGVGYYPLPTVA